MALKRVALLLTAFGALWSQAISNIGLASPAYSSYSWDALYNAKWPFPDLGVAGRTDLKTTAKGDGSADDSAAINAALAKGGIIDGAGFTYKVLSSITIPANVTLGNLTLKAGTPGMNVVLVHSYAKLINVKVIGTGTTNMIERGIYPAADGIVGVTLNPVEVSNLTVGIQLQPYTSAIANEPRHWYINAFCHDIVGKIGRSEGYGVLLSPASENEIHLRAERIARHALYISAGSQLNFAVADVDAIYNEGIQLSATAGQLADTAKNEIHVRCRNVQNGAGLTGQAFCAVVYLNSNSNTLFVDSDGTSGLSDGAVWVQGDQTTNGMHPTSNVVEVRSTGNYRYAAIASTDAINTTISTLL